MSDDEILSANETYGSLGELAIMSLPKQQILNLFKKLELGEVTKEMSTSEDFLSCIKDSNVKEIIAKESLEYHPSKSGKVFLYLFNIKSFWHGEKLLKISKVIVVKKICAVTESFVMGFFSTSSVAFCNFIYDDIAKPYSFILQQKCLQGHLLK